ITKSPVVEQYFSKKVEQHRPLVEKYADEYDVEEHVDVLMAMIMQESGGRGGDPMQSSESLCGEVNCITDPEESIKQGVAYFSKILMHLMMMWSYLYKHITLELVLLVM